MNHFLYHLLDASKFITSVCHLSDTASDIGLKGIPVFSHLLNSGLLLSLRESFQGLVPLYFFIKLLVLVYEHVVLLA